MPIDAEEACDDVFPRSQCPAADLHVDEVLHGDTDQTGPKENELALIGDVGPKDEFPASQRQPGQDDSWAQHRS